MTVLESYKDAFRHNFDQGFCIDVLEHIAEIAGFNYQIELVPDNNYGALNLTSGKWNGLVKGQQGTCKLHIWTFPANSFARIQNWWTGGQTWPWAP